MNPNEFYGEKKHQLIQSFIYFLFQLNIHCLAPFLLTLSISTGWTLTLNVWGNQLKYSTISSYPKFFFQFLAVPRGMWDPSELSPALEPQSLNH